MSRVARASAALALVAAAVAALLLVSGGSDSDPQTPAALPGLPPPFLGTAVVGDGGLTAAVDAYGDVVDLRASPGGSPLLAVSARRQAAGTVAPETAIVPELRLDDGESLPFWQADEVRQRYLPGTNVLETMARFGALTASVTYFAAGQPLKCLTRVTGGAAADESPQIGLSYGGESSTPGRLLRCDAAGGRAAMTATARSDREWVRASAPLASAPAWATSMYERSLLTLRALADRHTGGAIAGARDGWVYVWPRDAGTVTLAFAAGGHRVEARRLALLVRRLDLGLAARFKPNLEGSAVLGRGPQGDAGGWAAIANEVTGLNEFNRVVPDWRNLPDYQEKAPGDYLGNAIADTATEPPAARRKAAAAIARTFGGPRGLHRVADDPGSGLDSAAAWAVRPFALPSLYPAARTTLRQMLARGGRFGIVPSSEWPDRDPWTAPTAWSAWAFAALARDDRQHGDTALARADRADALRLFADLRRAATAAGELPERVDADSGIPRSTTPLAWSHAFAVLALRELWSPTG
jgi:hypothetical protein